MFEAFLGRNVAGGSMTIKMLLGMTHPTSAPAASSGHRIEDPRESLAMRRRIADVAEDKHNYE